MNLFIEKKEIKKKHMNNSIKIGSSIFELKKGDITLEDTDAIVNAANKRLSPGGGVSGAIHRAAGPELWDEAKTLGGCNTGEAKITNGYMLKARFVIHTVGPVYSGSSMDAMMLADCYKNSLFLAEKKDLASISFPSISTGIFGYPVNKASRVAIETIMSYLENSKAIDLVRMVLFSENDFSVYRDALADLSK